MGFKELSLRALGCGYSCFPVLCYIDKKTGKREKKPLVDAWQLYAYKNPSQSELDRWYGTTLIERYAGVGIPTGNGFSVIDLDATHPLDPTEIMQVFDWYDPATFTGWVKTGGGGMHLYVRGELTNGTNVLNGDKKTGGIQVDIRGVGGFVVGDGSPLWSGDPRDVENPLPVMVNSYSGNVILISDLPACPDIFTTRARVAGEAKYKKLGDVEKIKNGQGERHGVAISLALSVVNRAKGVEEFAELHEAFKNTIRQTFENTDPDDEEYTRMWWDAVEKRKKEKGVMWSRIEPVIRESVREERAKKELEKWDFKVIKAQRIEERVRITVELTDGRVAFMTMEVKDLYSQVKFREAFTVGTNRMLERVKNPAFEQFLSQLDLQELKDTGTSLADIVLDVVTSLFNKMKESKTEEERVEAMKNRGFAKFGQYFWFKLTRLKAEPDLRTTRASALAQALQDLEAEMESKNIWKIKIE